MKRALTSVGFVMAFVSLLVLGLVTRVQAKECANASLKGTYGLSCEGTIVGVGSIAVIGVFTADGNGTGSEVETISVNGVITTGATFTVTYTVNADGTGTMTFAGIRRRHFVIGAGGNELKYIGTDPTGGDVVGGSMVKQ